MIVIAHQAPGPHTPVEAIAHAAKIIDEFLAVLVIQKNISLRIAARHEVIERAFEFDSYWTSREAGAVG